MAVESTRWPGWEQAERHQDERRGWHVEAMSQNDMANARHGKGVRNIWLIALLRPVIELAILIVLVAHWWG